MGEGGVRVSLRRGVQFYSEIGTGLVDRLVREEKRRIDARII